MTPTPHGQVPEALNQLFERLEDCIYEWSNYVRADDAPTTLPKYTAGAINSLRVAVAELYRRSTHVQNPAEIERIAGDVSKTGAELNMRAKQPAPAPESFLEIPDVQDESGINSHYSRELVLECINAALASHGQAPAQASPAAVAVPTFEDFCKRHGLDPKKMDGNGGMWARVALDECRAITTQPAPQQEAQEPATIDQKTMELAESVGLIGPASRVGELHAAIQRFHDLICANATIKAAQMAAEAISEAAPQQGGVCDKAPAGWLCTRQHGHEGPCAAEPTLSARPDEWVEGYAAGVRDGWKDALRTQQVAPTPQADSVTTPAGGADWQDISTAPKDGTRFVAVGQNYGLDSEAQHTCIAQWLAGCWVEVSDWNGASKLKYLTHWMPLPPLPCSAARAPADSVLEDAARLEFEMQHGSAIAAARKQGANHD